jgi:hypothetical protein
MKQREVQDAENITWTCVQAFAGTSGQAAAEAAERVESADGKVPVVCTPSGGKQSVRLELDKDWAEELSDKNLLAAIEAAQ